MLSRTNDAAVRSRAIPAPMLNDFGPHNGGAIGVPRPSGPWHRAHTVPTVRCPAAVSAVSDANRCSAALGPLGGALTAVRHERNARYAMMSFISGLDGSSALPFKLRAKQSLTRSSISSTEPRRLRYWG